MIRINIPDIDLYDENQNKFIIIKGQDIQLEHSLVSLSKWESKWKKPFISKLKEKTSEEWIDYIRCMTLTQNVNPDIYKYIPQEEILKVKKYIEDPMTATTFTQLDQKPDRSIVTAEIIYYAMIAYNIPFECQKWHLNKLLTLIKVCSIKNAPNKKMSKHEIMNKNSALNAARRKAHNTKG